MKLSLPRRLALPTLLVALSLASACAPHISTQLPPAADVEAATEAKPVPTLAIATDAKAAAQYSADVESWGERVQAAGVRVCQWLNRMGGKYDCGR